MRIVKVLLTPVLCCLLASSSQAQGGGIEGEVTGPGGVPLPEIEVSLYQRLGHCHGGIDARVARTLLAIERQRSDLHPRRDHRRGEP